MNNNYEKRKKGEEHQFKNEIVINGYSGKVRVDGADTERVNYEMAKGSSVNGGSRFFVINKNKK